MLIVPKVLITATGSKLGMELILQMLEEKYPKKKELEQPFKTEKCPRGLKMWSKGYEN